MGSGRRRSHATRGGRERPAVVLLARAPSEGRVKSRLALRHGAKGALILYEAFLLDTLVWLRPLIRSGWKVRVEWSEPFDPAGALRRALGGFESGVQSAGGLGRRIHSGLGRLLARGASFALALGSDSPQLGAAPLRRARKLLRHCDVVLGPSLDGGYYLVGLRRVRRCWFEGIAWGTRYVLRQSLSRLRADRARVMLLPVERDLDTPADLAHLERRLRTSPGLRRRLKFTARALEAIGEAERISPSRRGGARRRRGTIPRRRPVRA